MRPLSQENIEHIDEELRLINLTITELKNNFKVYVMASSYDGVHAALNQLHVDKITAQAKLRALHNFLTD